VEQSDDKKQEILLSAKDEDELRDQYIKNSSSEEAAAIKMLTLDLAPFVKTLDRDIVTFNYRDKTTLKISNDEIPSTETKKGIEYAKGWGGAVKTHLPDEGGMVGWGLYSSGNISSSSSYANRFTDFSLVTVKYPKSGKMLDIRKIGSAIPMSPTTANYLAKICPYLSSRIWTKNIVGKSPSALFDKTDLTRNKKCHDIFVAVLEKLDISGLIYKWDGDKSSNCDYSNKAAFVAVNLKLNEESIDTFTNLDINSTLPKKIKNSRKFKRLPASDQSNLINGNFKGRVGFGKIKGFSKEDFRKYQKHGLNISGFNYHPFSKSFKAFSSSAPEKKKLLAEIRKESFGCDEKYKEADAPHYEPNQSLKYIINEGFSDLSLSDDLQNKLNGCYL
jgi:hypothetical protein